MGSRATRRSSDARSWTCSKKADQPRRSHLISTPARSRTPGDAKTGSTVPRTGRSSREKAELRAARKQIADLETEPAAERRAIQLPKEPADPRGGTRRRK